MKTIKAILHCAMALLFMLAASALAQAYDRVPDQKEDVIIKASPKNVKQRGNEADVTPTGADVTIGSGVTLTLGPGVTMSLGGNFTNNGTFDAQHDVQTGAGATVEFNGTAAQTLSGSSYTVFYNLTKSGSGLLSLGTGMSIEVDGGTLTLNGDINNCPGTLNIRGGGINPTGTGSLQCQPTYLTFPSVTYTNPALMTTGFELPPLVLNLTINGGGIRLGSNVTVNGNLTLTNGNLWLNGHTILVNGSIIGADPTKYVITDLGGVLTLINIGASQSLVATRFPVGTPTSYIPVDISNSGTSDDFSVNVMPTFDFPPGDSNRVVKRQWTITEGTPGGSNATLEFQWNTGDQAPGFSTSNPNNIVVGRHNGSKWVEQTAAFTSSPLTAQISGVTSFSPFAVGNTNALRTVVLANLKFFLEGPFNTGTNLMTNSLRASILPARFPGRLIPGGAVDSIQIEIRGTPTSSPLPTKPMGTRIEVADVSHDAAIPTEQDLFVTKDALPAQADAERSERALKLEDPFSSLPPNPKVSQPAWLLTDGTIRNFTDTTKNYIEFDTTAGNWYVVIRHRNHLAIMTAAAQALSSISPVTAYDFTTAQTQAYGTNPMKPLNGRYCIFAGDADGSASIDALDRTAAWNNRNLTGYLSSDADLSGDVSALDRTITWNNRNLSTQVP